MSVDFGSKLVCGYKVPKNLLENYDNMTEAIEQLTEAGYWHRASSMITMKIRFLVMFSVMLNRDKPSASTISSSLRKSIIALMTQ